MCAPAACASGVRFVDFLVLGSYFGRRTFGGWGLVCVAVLRRGVDGDYRAPAGRASGDLRRAKASSEIRSSVSAVFSPDMLC